MRARLSPFREGLAALSEPNGHEGSQGSYRSTALTQHSVLRHLNCHAVVQPASVPAPLRRSGVAGFCRRVPGSAICDGLRHGAAPRLIVRPTLSDIPMPSRAIVVSHGETRSALVRGSDSRSSTGSRSRGLLRQGSSLSFDYSPDLWRPFTARRSRGRFAVSASYRYRFLRALRSDHGDHRPAIGPTGDRDGTGLLASHASSESVACRSLAMM